MKTKNKKESAKKVRTPPPLIPALSIECLERNELLLCGAKKIEFYSDSCVSVRTRTCLVKIRGENITLAFSGDGKIHIRGKFCSIEFI